MVVENVCRLLKYHLTTGGGNFCISRSKRAEIQIPQENIIQVTASSSVNKPKTDQNQRFQNIVFKDKKLSCNPLLTTVNHVLLFQLDVFADLKLLNTPRSSSAHCCLQKSSFNLGFWPTFKYNVCKLVIPQGALLILSFFSQGLWYIVPCSFFLCCLYLGFTVVWKFNTVLAYL